MHKMVDIMLYNFMDFSPTNIHICIQEMYGTFFITPFSPELYHITSHWFRLADFSISRLLLNSASPLLCTWNFPSLLHSPKCQKSEVQSDLKFYSFVSFLLKIKSHTACVSKSENCCFIYFAQVSSFFKMGG